VLAGGGVATRVSGQATTPYLLPGVLQLRASGIGWAKIADSMGIMLRPAVNGNAHPAAYTPPPISSAWITTTVAVTPRNAAVARQPAPARSPARGAPEPEIRRSGASIVAAAPGVAKAGHVTMPVRDSVNSPVVVPRAVIEAPGAADELIRQEEGQSAD